MANKSSPNRPKVTVRKRVRVAPTPDNQDNLFKKIWIKSGEEPTNNYVTLNTILWTILIGCFIIWTLFEGFISIFHVGFFSGLANIFQTLLMSVVALVVWYINARFYPWSFLKIRSMNFTKAFHHGMKIGKQEYNDNLDTSLNKPTRVQETVKEYRPLQGNLWSHQGFFGNTEYQYVPTKYAEITHTRPTYVESNKLNALDNKITSAQSGLAMGIMQVFLDLIVFPFVVILLWPFSFISGVFNLYKYVTLGSIIKQKEGKNHD